MIDVLFLCDAGPRAGFGHLARCLMLAELLSTRIDGLKIAFSGEYSDEAQARFATLSSATMIVSGSTLPRARLGVIDRLAKPDDMNSWDPGLARNLRARCVTCIAILSGVVAPSAEGFLEIGYQPVGPGPLPPNRLWSFDYAPVAPGRIDGSAPAREPATALVALGGSLEQNALRLAVAALAETRGITRIDVLRSPVNCTVSNLPLPRADQQLVAHENLPDVATLLRRAGVVVASFGNLTYEALALGAPVCLLGQKPFQTVLAMEFAKAGIAVDAGLASEIDSASLSRSIRRTLEASVALSRAGPRAIDGRGLKRIAEILERALKTMPVSQSQRKSA